MTPHSRTEAWKALGSFLVEVSVQSFKNKSLHVGLHGVLLGEGSITNIQVVK